jgi:hypothetical protein
MKSSRGNSEFINYLRWLSLCVSASEQARNFQFDEEHSQPALQTLVAMVIVMKELGSLL